MLQIQAAFERAQVKPSGARLRAWALLLLLTAGGCLRTSRDDGGSLLASAKSAPASSARSKQPEACAELADGADGFEATYDWSDPLPAKCESAENVPEPMLDAGAEPRLEPNAAVVVVKGLIQGFKDCYHRTLALDGCEEGSLRLWLDVDCSGGVRSLRAQARTLSSKTVQCVMDVASKARFGAPSAGSAQFEVPISFRRP